MAHPRELLANNSVDRVALPCYTVITIKKCGRTVKKPVGAMVEHGRTTVNYSDIHGRITVETTSGGVCNRGINGKT